MRAAAAVAASRQPRSGASREAIADRAQRVDRRRAARQRELAPQVAHVDLDDVRAGIEVVAPDGAEDLLAAEHLAGVAQEVGEQVELARGEAQLDAVARDLRPSRSSSMPAADSVVALDWRGVRRWARTRAASSSKENGLVT